MLIEFSEGEISATMFSSILNDIYANKKISKETVSYYITAKLITKDFSTEELKKNLASQLYWLYMNLLK